jgi:uncharacterized membrane protein YfcA
MGIVLLPLLGFGVGALGTLVGAGGGFILVPVLLFVYPDDPPAVITTISLAVVFLNALSGSLAYARQGRIDYRSGLLFAAAAVPGAVLGAWAVRFLSRGLFNLVFGVLLLAIALLLALRPVPHPHERKHRPGAWTRALVDRAGHHYRWSYRAEVGTALSFLVGFISSVLGIGGGIIHVPILVMLLSFPIHIATATSHFVLAITAFAGTLTHLLSGEFGAAWSRTLLIGAGVVAGAQLGAALAPRARPAFITRSLALGLALVGARLLWRSISG